MSYLDKLFWTIYRIYFTIAFGSELFTSDVPHTIEFAPYYAHILHVYIFKPPST